MKELTRNCRRSGDVRPYSKLVAAQHQLEAAIANLFLGNWPTAITLASTAEDILPPRDDDSDIFSIAKTTIAAKYGVSGKIIADCLNEQRNWLKHHQSENQHLKEEMNFAQADAVAIILRAYSRFHSHHHPLAQNEILSKNLGEFDEWLHREYGDWLLPEETKVPE